MKKRLTDNVKTRRFVKRDEAAGMVREKNLKALERGRMLTIAPRTLLQKVKAGAVTRYRVTEY